MPFEAIQRYEEWIESQPHLIKRIKNTQKEKYLVVGVNPKQPRRYSCKVNSKVLSQ